MPLTRHKEPQKRDPIDPKTIEGNSLNFGCLYTEQGHFNGDIFITAKDANGNEITVPIPIAEVGEIIEAIEHCAATAIIGEFVSEAFDTLTQGKKH